MRRPAWLLAVVLISTLVSIVIVVLSDHANDIGSILEVAMPVLAALFVADRVDARADEHKEGIEKVKEQTNGALSREYQRGIEDGRRAAVREHMNEDQE